MVTNLRRYLRLYLVLVKTNLARELQFRAHFILDNLVTVIWSGLLILYYIFIYQYVSQVRGWSLAQILVLTGVYLSFNSILKSVIEQNFSQFVRIIYRGELDFYLLKPVDSQFLLSFFRFSLRSLVRMVLGIAVLIWGLSLASVPVTVAGAVQALFSFSLGLVIVYSLWFITLLLAFRLGNIDNLYFLFMPIFQVSRMPITVFPKPIELLFSLAIPLVFVATIPLLAVWQTVSWWMLGYAAVAGIGLLWLSHRLWNLALRSYVSASS
jgi:ABC-2 type transport system permease protein